MAVIEQDGAPLLSAKPPAPRKKVQHSRYDQDLFRAKNEGTRVKFALACDWYLADEDGTVVGYIEQVDRYDIEVRLDGGARVWLKKQLIVSTTVQR